MGTLGRVGIGLRLETGDFLLPGFACGRGTLPSPTLGRRVNDKKRHGSLLSWKWN